MARDNFINIPLDGDCYVVGEIADFQTPLPANIHAGCMLERASADTQRYLSGLVGALLFWNSNPFEMARDTETRRTTSLPQDQWRYFLLRKPDDVIPVSVLKSAALSDPSIYLGPHFYRLRGQSAFGSTPGIQNHYWNTHQWWNSGKVVTGQTISKWAELAKLLEYVETNYPEIGRSVHMYWLLSGNDPTYDRLTILGYFIVIESLLTHKPRPNDPTDAIARQIRSKIQLLGNRMAPDLTYTAFAESNPNSVWSVLYDYRSTLAHGGEPDFKKDKLRQLRDEPTVISFLQNACRCLLRQALNEPKLCSDLKNC
jgi:hypothetical protein